MIKSKTIPKLHTTPQPSYYGNNSFKLISTLLTEALVKNRQRIVISAKTGDFLHDHTTGIESTETSNLCIESSNVIQKEQVTEILIDGSIRRRNGNGNNFSVYFTMKRNFMVIPHQTIDLESFSKTNSMPNVFGISGMLYNSVFSLDLKCVEKTGRQFPLGKGRGYLIFDKENL